jgi:hypothetical protein
MIRVCSWCQCLLGEAATGGGRPTHGICPSCLVSVLEELEAMASRHGRPVPTGTWLIVVAPDDAARFRELQQRFAQSRLVDVIRDRRRTASPLAPSIASPTDRRGRVRSQEHDRRSHGFFVIYLPSGSPAPKDAKH